MPQNLTSERSTFVQVMAWCHQAPSHDLSQCWPRYMSPYSSLGHNELRFYQKVVFTWVVLHFFILTLIHTNIFALWYPYLFIIQLLHGNNIFEERSVFMQKCSFCCGKITASHHFIFIISCWTNTCIEQKIRFNLLWPSDAMWWQMSGSILAEIEIMACCLMAPSHHLNQCQLIFCEVFWHLPEGDIYPETTSNEFKNYNPGDKELRYFQMKWKGHHCCFFIWNFFVF